MIEQIFKKEGKLLNHINYIFCSDDYLLDLNKKYLNHNTLTDIITFELNELGKPTLSDVFISIQRVNENAKMLKVPKYEETLRVIFHGALHLCGYKDKAKMDKAIMRRKEEHYIALFKSFT